MPTLATQTQESHNHRHDEVSFFDQNFLRKALRILFQMKSFVKKCRKNKTKILVFVALANLQESVELLLHQDQHNFSQGEFKTLETTPQVKPQNQRPRLCPFLQECMLCVGERLAQAAILGETFYAKENNR